MRQIAAAARGHGLGLGMKGGSGEAPAELSSREVRSLVSRLIEACAERAPGTLMEGPEAVLLDLVVDGVRCVLSLPGPEGDPAQGGAALSPREREIARMVAKGLPNKVIARVLEISAWTVSTHLRRIFAKLGVSTRASMVAQLLAESPQRRR